VGGKGRTRMRKMQFTFRDAVAISCTVIICAVIIFMNFQFEALI
jgi:energy-coupling factor transporter transmembrane protein EcfT